MTATQPPSTPPATSSSDWSGPDRSGVLLLVGLLIAVWLLAGWMTRIPSLPPRTAAERYAATAPEWRRLWGAVRARLDTARPVAHAKWSTQAAILDAPREAAKLASLANQGARLGLPEPLVQAVFRELIEAHKQRQAEWMTHWRKPGQAPTSPPPDLVREVRPQLDRIDAELLAALQACQQLPLDQRHDRDWHRICESQGQAYSPEVRAHVLAVGKVVATPLRPAIDTD